MGLAVSNHDTTQNYSATDSAILLTNKIVLMVENDVDTIEVINHVFQGWGATVYVFNNIKDALSDCPICSDLLFVDYHLDNDAIGT